MPAEDTPTPPRKKIHLVPVEGEEELERVLVEDLDCRVEQRDGEQLAVGRVPDGEDVVRHFQSLGVNEREDLLLELEDVRTTKAGQNSVDFERRCGKETHRSCDTQAIRRHLRPIVHLDHLKIPKLNVLVGTARHETLLVRSDLDGPDRT